ncbi:ferredoxin [Streptomyces sp. SAI-229]|uniref:ferredoxin n=1 Tax=Streptomyces sp. SAI-229 TaxID=3377731 RepID=UPI003C7C760D
MRINTEPEVCVGSGQCALAVPEVFDQDDEGTIVLLDANPAEEFHRDVHEAVSRCPVRAITVVDP